MKLPFFFLIVIFFSWVPHLIVILIPFCHSMAFVWLLYFNNTVTYISSIFHFKWMLQVLFTALIGPLASMMHAKINVNYCCSVAMQSDCL